MLLNHERQTPAHWDDSVPSLCPDCQGAMIPRRGRVVIWHWAHKAKPRTAATVHCLAAETYWHLAWKMVYHGFNGWGIEVPFEANGRHFRADAMRADRGKVREFVHSLSDRYIDKHLSLKRAGLDVLWIFDGDKFTADRRKAVGGYDGAGYKHLLKPKARWLQGIVGGLVHWDGSMWKEWKNDVWYRQSSDVIDGMLERFCQIEQRLTAGVGP